MEEKKDAITMEDLQGPHREVAEVIGLENMILLSEMFGGSSLYIPQKKELLKNHTYRMISEEFDGTNIKKLASRYDVSEATVYRIVKDRIGKISIPGQMSFADCGL